MKKFIKYVGIIVLGLITAFMGLLTYYAYTPDESYHHCEAGQNDGSPYWCFLITAVLLVTFCIVWYKTRKW
jgi:sterol desaturase/sphingolipid hydroxylase (fatty acid hydroxylase superfamily)